MFLSIQNGFSEDRIGSLIALIFLALVLLIILIRNIRVVPQAHNFIIERLGTYKATWDTGLHM